MLRLICGCLGALTLLAACAGQVQPHDGEDFFNAQLAALEALPAPPEVRAQDWQELKTALRSMIVARLAEPAKLATAAPGSDAAQMPLQFDLDEGMFLWRYYSPGDYDQNGEVNVADLTALGAHLNEAVPVTPESENTIQAVVDGDGNGLITIADLTPLGANLGRRVTHFHIFHGSSEADVPAENTAPSTLPPANTVDFAEKIGNPTQERLYFTRFGHSLDSGVYFVRPVDGVSGQEGTPSSVVSAALSGALLAALEASQFNGTVPLTTTLNASQSYFLGAPLKYAFDPEGDGIYNPADSAYTLTHTYETLGVFSAAVRVSTATGLIKRAQIAINAGASPEWHSYAVPTPDPDQELVPHAIALGQATSLPYAVAAYRRPAENNYQVTLYRSEGQTGNSWGWQIGLYTTAQTINGVQLADDVQGQPALMTAEGGALIYRRANNFPADWGAAVTVAATGLNDLSWYSFKEVNNTPSVAYHNPTVDSLGFVSALDLEGTLWSVPQAPVGFGNIGKSASLAEINGRPAIAYRDAFLDTIHYVDSNGSAHPYTWNAPDEVAFGDLLFYDSLVALADGSPAVAYHYNGVNRVYFRRAVDSAGDTWPVPAEPANTTGPQATPRALVVGGIAHVFWVEQSGALWHVYTTDASGQLWAAPQSIDGGVDYGVQCAPAQIIGLPAVAYALESGEFRTAIRY